MPWNPEEKAVYWLVNILKTCVLVLRVGHRPSGKVDGIVGSCSNDEWSEGEMVGSLPRELFPFPLACWRRNDCGRLRSMSFIYLMWGFNSSPAALVRSLGSQVRFFLSPNQCLPAPTEMTKADSPWRVSGVLGCFQFTSVKLDLPLKDLIKFPLNSTAKLLLKPTAAGHKRWILIYYNTTKANAGFAMNPWNSGIRKRWKRTVKTCCYFRDRYIYFK